ncbi:unnamed protein product [Rotaria sordida]|uniref:Uncharacterized protein n=1 Tax=Rotaria sordida TaxID=392033 RepID=A0A814NTY0_9BILA|nr:unnamed protein product [Rotaria sordida]CAF1095557.1 unnamed protein product [Rotaria sordida]CAF1097906.1 unnamed protein product [Rotaria sordida]CAF3700877.1 unnamed protein product [Rotaria sordida]CAF3880652.1 unnamed protein product [Rotaria sordida]
MLSSTSQSLLSNNSLNDELYCPTVFENLCWPQTLANHSITISCSLLAMPGVDSSKFLTRHCLTTGIWSNVSFKPCVYSDVWDLMNTFYISKTLSQRKRYTDILQAVRIIELVGLSVSFISVLVSLIIFFTLKSLYCSRTKIHINLLLAIFIQIIARIVNYGIQMKQSNNSSQIESIECGNDGSIRRHGISSILKNMCPLIVIFLQFSISSMFMWMLCEGIHLNNILTVSVFKNYFKTYYFYILGWIVPLFMTLSWSIVMFVKERDRKCWSNYNYLKYYWIIDGPRYAINFIFLLNIIRVLLVKIKEGSEKQIREEKHRRSSMNTKFVRKAVKAAIFLLPLFGITHMVETFVSPDPRSIALFALYCSVTYFLVTFQGFFCALLYCFLNTEVRETLSRRLQATQLWARWKLWLGHKDRYQNGTSNSDDRTRLELLIPPSNLGNKSAFEMDNRRLKNDADASPQ